MKLTEVVKLTELAKTIATRLERIGVDENGALDSDDAKLIADVRRQCDVVLTFDSRIKLDRRWGNRA